MSAKDKADKRRRQKRNNNREIIRHRICVMARWTEQSDTCIIHHTGERGDGTTETRRQADIQLRKPRKLIKCMEREQTIDALMLKMHFLFNNKTHDDATEKVRPETGRQGSVSVAQHGKAEPNQCAHVREQDDRDYRTQTMMLSYRDFCFFFGYTVQSRRRCFQGHVNLQFMLEYQMINQISRIARTIRCVRVRAARLLSMEHFSRDTEGSLRLFTSTNNRTRSEVSVWFPFLWMISTSFTLSRCKALAVETR